jgi:hypothetical protein
MTGIIRSICCICLSAYAIYAACPLSQASGGTPGEKIQRLKGIDGKTFDNTCMDTILEALKNESDRDLFMQFEKLIESWSASKGFPLSLFSRCAEIPFFAQDHEAGRRMATLWERRNKPFASAINNLTNAGRQDAADSLYRAFDRCTRLGPDVLLRWAAVKEVRAAYGSALRLYCRSINADPRIAVIAFDRLSQLFNNAPRDTVRSALAALEECVYSARGIDTLMAQQWIADAYAEHDYVAEEIRALERFGSTSQELTVRMFDIARIQEQKGAYDQAIRAAGIVYGKARNDQIRRATAAIACRSFQAQHRLDSALNWLERCDLSTERGKIDAVILYQQSGRLQQAQSMIDGMRKSFSRDTLEIRQRLFSGDTKNAFELARLLGREWTDHTSDVILWNVRCLLFHGAADEAGAILDSMPLFTSRESGEELLNYRYYWNLLSRSKEALALWVKIEYDLFIGQAERAVETMKEIVLPEEMRMPLLLRLLRELKAAGRMKLLKRQFDAGFAGTHSPEYLYLHAETLIASGTGKAKAEELLLRLIKDYPDDVFSQKARILLSRLHDQS